jgi:acyl carrier protein
MKQQSEDNDRSVRSAVRDFIVTNFLFGGAANTFADRDSFIEKGIIDSTGILELVQFLETEYRISLKQDELVPANLDSLEKISVFVSKKLTGDES